MSGTYIVRYVTFFAMSLVAGIVAAFSPAGAVGAAVMAFGYGVAEICDAVEARRERP